MRLFRLVVFIFGVVAMVGMAGAAFAEKRIALVIGNSDYRFTPSLLNPKNDAADIAAALERVGFDVDLQINLSKANTDKALRRFGDRLEGAKAAVFYYAGHGIQVDGTNYVVPIDAQLEKERDLNYEVVSLNTVLKEMEVARRVNLVFMDACRDNPLSRSLARSMGAIGRSSAVGRGLAPVEAATGTMISYATKDNAVAADGSGRNSPYTKGILEHIETPGLEVGLMLRRVRQSVMKDTGDVQVPWDYGSLLGEFYFNSPQSPSQEQEAAPEPPSAPSAGTSAEVVFWQSIQDSKDADDFEAYLEQYPKGAFAALARVKIKKYAKAETKIAAVTPAEPETGKTPTENKQVASLPPAQPKVEEIAPKKKVFKAKSKTVAPIVRSVLARASAAAREESDGTDRSSQISSVAEIQIQAGDLEGAAQNAEAALESANHYVAEYQKYLAMISVLPVLVKLGELERALAIANSIPEAEYRVWNLTMIARAQGSLKDNDGATQTLQQAFEGAQGILSTQKRDGYMSNIVGELGTIGNHEKALEVVNTISGNDDSIEIPLSSVIHAQLKAGKLEEAIATNRRIKEGSVFKATYSIVHAYAQTGDFKSAFAFDERNGGKHRDVLMNQMINKKIEDGDFAAARKDIRTLSPGKRAPLLINIAYAQLKAIKMGDARRTLKSALRDAENAPDNKTRVDALLSIRGFQYKIGDGAAARRSLDEAVRISEDIKDKAQRSSALSAIAAVQAKARDKTAALNTLKSAVKAARDIKDDATESAHLMNIAKAQAENGDLKAAFKTANYIPADHFYFYMVLPEIAKIQGPGGDRAPIRKGFQRAVKAANKKDGVIYQSSALSQIVPYQVKSNDLDGALRTADSIHQVRNDYRVTALLNIAGALLDMQEAEEKRIAEEKEKKTANK